MFKISLIAFIAWTL